MESRRGPKGLYLHEAPDIVGLQQPAFGDSFSTASLPEMNNLISQLQNQPLRFAYKRVRSILVYLAYTQFQKVAMTLEGPQSQTEARFKQQLVGSEEKFKEMLKIGQQWKDLVACSDCGALLLVKDSFSPVLPKHKLSIAMQYSSTFKDTEQLCRVVREILSAFSPTNRVSTSHYSNAYEELRLEFEHSTPDSCVAALEENRSSNDERIATSHLPTRTQGRQEATSSHIVQSIQTPTGMHVTESLLQCVGDFAALMLNKRQKRACSISPGRKEMMNQQPREGNREQTRVYITATVEVFENAHYFLKRGEPSKAIQRLKDAEATAPRMFDNPDLFLLIRLIEIATWSSWKRFPEYERVVFPFVATLSRDSLGEQHPLTLLLDCFSKAAAISKSYPTLWMCVIDHIDQMADEQLARGEAQELRIKAYFYLVRVLRNNQDHSEAVKQCQELIQFCIATDGLCSFSANRARYNLAVNYCEAGKLEAAMKAYDETREYLRMADCTCEGWVFAVFATNELAQLYEQQGNIDKAGKYYEEALVSFLRCESDESSGALLMLKDLIDFYKRFSHEEQLARVRIQYHASDALISAGRLDDVRLWVGCRVTTQASGGKMNRAWTWTSPIA